MESGLLAVVILLPLFFNVYSQRVFEPDKIALMRSIAILTGAAWLLLAMLGSHNRNRHGTYSGNQVYTSFWSQLLKNPIVFSTLFFGMTSLVSTFVSLAPRLSILGSYNRLQGSYTLISYIFFFFMAIRVIRTRWRLERLVTALILAGFPIALYGVLQHFEMDPLIWAKNVSKRASSSMGNPIFLGGYLVMVIPLTLSRVLEYWGKATGPLRGSDVFAGFGTACLPAVGLLAGVLMASGEKAFWFRWGGLLTGICLQIPCYLFLPRKRFQAILVVSVPLTFGLLACLAWLFELFFPPANPYHFWMGLSTLFIATLAMSALGIYAQQSATNYLLTSLYLSMLVTQVVCLLCTQARGPFLGMAVGGFFYFAITGITRRQKWITYSVMCSGFGALLFLFLLNTSNLKVIEDLRNTPYVGRFGKLLGNEPTAKVRLLIWGGVMDSIGNPVPVKPDGETGTPDRFHFIRPLLGYGPETMQTVFHRVHPSGLTRYSSPNAVPDRSHNESLDVFVTTGGLGLATYLALVTSIVCYGLVSLKLVRNRKDKMSFLGLWIGCGFACGVGAWLVTGRASAALGLPFGLILGLASYILLKALKSISDASRPKDTAAKDSCFLIALFSGLLAHFIEVHIGITTATTSTYFWLFAALIVATGTQMHKPQWQGYDTRVMGCFPRNERREKKPPAGRVWIGAGSILRSPMVATLSFVALLVLSTLIFSLLHSNGDTGRVTFLLEPWIKTYSRISAPLLTLLITSWAVFAIDGFFETGREGVWSKNRIAQGMCASSIITLISLSGTFLYTGFQSVKILTLRNSDLTDTAGVLIPYVVLLSVSLTGLALHRGFASTISAEKLPMRSRRFDPGFGILAAILGVGMAWSAWKLNFTPLVSDMIHKRGSNFENFGHLDSSIKAYEEATHRSKTTEVYYTSLGRAYLQKAFKTPEPERNSWLGKSESALLHAKDLAPLDPVHSLNLGRLYYRWGQIDKEELRMRRYRQAGKHFAIAHSLSPKREAILNEWGQYCLLMDEPMKAELLYKQSLTLDNQYQETWLRLGELYINQKKWDEAGSAYDKAIKIGPESITALKGLGYVAYHKGDMDRALQYFKESIKIAPEDYESRKNLAVLHLQTRERDRAVTQAEEAFLLVPEPERKVMLDVLDSIRHR